MSKNKEPERNMREALGDAWDKMQSKDEPEEKPEKKEAKEAKADTKEPGAEDNSEGKSEDKAEDEIQAKEDVEEAEPPIEPEEHWSEPDKLAFRNIPAEHRTWVMERYKRIEADNTRKSQEAATLRAFRASLEQVYEPHKAEFAAQGLDEIGAVRSLFAIRENLKKNPQATLQWLAQQFNVDLSGLNNAEEADPQTQAISQAMQQMTNRLSTFEQTLNQDRTNQAMKMLDNFMKEKDDSGNIRHPHFEAVTNDITQLMQAGIVPLGDLQAAYDKAMLLHPELVKTEKKAQVKASPDTVKQDELTKAATAAKAKKASLGVKGDGGGKSEQKLTLRQELEARMDGSLH